MAAIPTILRGDDSGTITLNIASGRTYTGATLVVAYQGVTRSFTNLTAGGTVSFSFTHDETANMAAKTAPVLMRLVGSSGSEETVENADARIKVTDCLAEVNTGGTFSVAPSGYDVPVTDVGDIGDRYTVAQLQEKINQIVHVLAQRSLLALALLLSCACCFPASASIVQQTCAVSNLCSDATVVTNVTGAATDPQVVTNIVSGYVADATNATLASAKAYTDASIAAGGSVTPQIVTNIVKAVVTNDVGGAWTTGRSYFGGDGYALTNTAVRWNDGHWEVRVSGVYDGLAVDGWFVGAVYNPDYWAPYEITNANPSAVKVTTLKYAFDGSVSAAIYADRTNLQHNALGLAYERDIMPTVTNTVTKAYVESLGVSAGLTTNDVQGVIDENVNTNYLCTVAAAAEMTNDASIVRLIDDLAPGAKRIFVPGTSDGFNGLELSYNGFHRRIQSGEQTYEIIGYILPNVSGTLALAATTLSGYGIMDAYTKDEVDAAISPISSSVSSLNAATNNIAANVSGISSSVSAISAYLNAEDAHFVSTNYDSTVRTPEAYVEVKVNGSWLTIWKEMTRWNEFTGTNFDWNAWGDFYSWETNVTTQLSDLADTKADRCWGAYDSETGGYSPEGFTQISSSNVMIAANMAYQRTVTTGGAVWVLQCNNGHATLGGDTNGYFRVFDGDGNCQFEIIQGDQEELGADATGISVNNSTTPPTVTIPYSVDAADPPTLKMCDNLSTANWKSETDADRVANVTWTGTRNAYTATVQKVSAAAPQELFVKATYMAGGETYINNRAPVGMSSIYLNGTKYYLGTATINGHTVLTLSTTAP